MSEETVKVGRPKKLEPTKKVFSFIQGLASIFCTQKEAAKVFSVSRSTFCAFLAEHEKVRTAWEAGAGTSRASLRRFQFKLAKTSAAMAIFLGKNYLGQKDVIFVERGDDLPSASSIAVLTSLLHDLTQQKALTARTTLDDRPQRLN